MNKRVFTATVLILLGGLFLARLALACGPSFIEIRYQDPGILDVPAEEVAQGHYGVLRQGLPWADLLRVYRNLQGFSSPMPVVAADSSPKDREPLGIWREERAKVMVNEVGLEVARTFETAQFVTVNNVGDDALLKAAQTLSALIRTNGSGPAVKDWIQAQDLVFASTPVSPRIPAPVQESGGLVHTPEWLVQERAYQIASAQFYSGQWDLAQQGFRSIAADPHHPWQAWGLYLAARCQVRKAEIPTDTAADLEENRLRQERVAAGLPIYAREARVVDEHTKLACYREAQSLLEETLRDPGSTAIHQAAGQYLELVRYRTEPLALLGELLQDQSQADPVIRELAETKISDALNFLPKDKDYQPAPVGIPGDSDLAWWLGAMARHLPWHVDAETALARWRAHPSDTWLVASLSLAKEPSPDLEPLLAAAKKIPKQSPIAETARWHLLRLELSRLSGDALTQRLEKALHGGGLPPWAVNQLRSARQGLAQDTVTWLTYASRRPSAAVDYYLQIPGKWCLTETFDEGTARALGEQLPLSRVGPLLRAAKMPPISSQEVAKAAWTKAVLLEEWEQARHLSDLLSPSLRSAAAKALVGTEAKSLRFQAALLIMDWPGLRPTVETGLGRQYLGPQDGVNPLAKFDVIRDNWWCGSDTEHPRRQAGKAGPVAFEVPGLSASDREAAVREKALLDEVPSAQLWFGRAVLAYAKSHPDDDRVPYALHRFVWTIRSPLCLSEDASTLGKEAFQRLHKLYPKNPWTKKTPYYF